MQYNRIMDGGYSPVTFTYILGSQILVFDNSSSTIQ